MKGDKLIDNDLTNNSKPYEKKALVNHPHNMAGMLQSLKNQSIFFLCEKLQYNLIVHILIFLFKIFFKYSKKSKEKKEREIMFSMYCSHLHALFVVFHYFFLVDILLKNQIKIYIFDTFIFIFYFLITFLIESMLTLFFLNTKI